MKKIFISIFLVILLFNFGCGKKEKTSKVKKDDLPSVKVEVVKLSSIEDIITSTGTIEADVSVKVSSKMPGKVENIFYNEGDWVQKDVVLLKLETKELLAQKQQAEAMKKQAEASLENIKKNYERMKSLHSDGIVSKQSFEQIEMQLEVIEAQLDAAKANISLLNTQLDNSKILSPISGKISMKFAEVGEVIGAGIPIFQIIDTNSVKIKIGISEDKIKDVKIGRKVRIFSDAYPDKKFEGYINLISSSVNPANRLFEAEVKIPNKDALLKPGMFVNCEIVTREIKDAIIIPESAIIDEEDKKYVFVYQDSIARKKEVVTGIETKGNVEIKEGLNEGETIIIEGGYGLQNGTKVKKEE